MQPPTIPLTDRGLSPPAPLAVTMRATTQYYRMSQLTRKPRVLQDITPMMRLTVAGIVSRQVILRLLISEQGGIDRVEVDESDLPAVAQRALADAFASLRFSPGMLDQQAVPSQMRIEVSLLASAELSAHPTATPPVIDLRGK